MNRDVLIVCGIPGAEECGRALAEKLNSSIETADRQTALKRLRHGAYGAVVVEESLLEFEPEWADEVWAASGSAIPLTVNFGITGRTRLEREIRAALDRRASEHAAIRREVVAELEQELKSVVTGLLLESELALREPHVPPALANRMRHMVELAASLRQRLDR